jgi:putative DNA primase/helicase
MQWIAECCSTGLGHSTSTELYKSWHAWALAAGEQPGSQKSFSEALETKGFPKGKSQGVKVFKGLHPKALP